MKHHKTIVDINAVNITDIDLVGGKNASLGEMSQALEALGVRIPKGFIVTVEAYRLFLKYNDLEEKIQLTLQETAWNDFPSLSAAGDKIRRYISEGAFPDELLLEITEAYKQMSSYYNVDNVDVAVRSSATAEDLPDASFAGQQETFLAVSGTEQLLHCIKECFASLFTARAISYRESVNYDQFTIGISVCIQKMVRSDKASSGVAFSIDPESGFRDCVVINGAFGLGEMVVQGAVCPDEFIVFKPTLLQGFPSIIEKKLGRKDLKMVYSTNPGERVEIMNTVSQEFDSFCLNDEQILQLARWVVLIEEHYSNIHHRWCPMDTEWAVDGLSGELFIVQARPETIHSQKSSNKIVSYTIEKSADPADVLLTGVAVGDKIASGKVKIVHSYDKLQPQLIDFEAGDVLVTDMTDPDWEPLMKIASAIVTNRGGRTCHAAIVARELGVPAIVACQSATEILKDGQKITVSCGEGDLGIVYRGTLPFLKSEIEPDSLPATKIPVLLNVASPEKAFQFSQLPQSGVGLAREEFIINNYIKVHPLALLQYDKLDDEALKSEINDITRGFESGTEYFVQKLSFGIAKIAAAFYPNRVIIRFSDFKSNEYSNLLGGKLFEPREENPMIGWRGASRYYSEEFKQAFGLECEAIKRLRRDYGLTNLTVMIPFCRTVDELSRVYEVMESHGLKRGQEGLEVYLMAEIPSNIILAEYFSDHVDGFSIGSNDLTQLVLGLDRDSALVANLYDERNLAVKLMISSLIGVAKRKGVKVGICGQGPSDFPDFAQFLVESGIDTISVTPDAVVKTVKAIAEIEARISEDLKAANYS